MKLLKANYNLQKDNFYITLTPCAVFNAFKPNEPSLDAALKSLFRWRKVEIKGGN